MNLIDDVALPGSLRAIMFSMAPAPIRNTPIGLLLCIIFVLVTRNVMARHRQGQAPLRAAQGGS